MGPKVTTRDLLEAIDYAKDVVIDHCGESYRSKLVPLLIRAMEEIEWRIGSDAPRDGSVILAVTVLGEVAVMHWARFTYVGGDVVEGWWCGREAGFRTIEEPAWWRPILCLAP